MSSIRIITSRQHLLRSLADIVATLAKTERSGTLRERIRFFCVFALLIVAEMATCRSHSWRRQSLLPLVNTRYERPIILTSHLGFAECEEIFGDPIVVTALLDRLLHHAIVFQIEGSSYRLRQHVGPVPEHIRIKGLFSAIADPANPKAAAPATQKWRDRSTHG